MLIGLSGKKLSGKDESFRIIQRLIPKLFSNKGYIVRRYAFADPVKEMSEKYFGVNPKEQDKERVRFVWQGVGQMMREECDEEFWIKRIYDEYLKVPDKPHLGIITDVRYTNEAEFLIKKGYPVIRLSRTGGTPDSHPSEVDLDNFEFEHHIDNSGTLEDLEKQWTELLKRILL